MSSRADISPSASNQSLSPSLQPIALLFDLDGTISLSDDDHFHAFRNLLLEEDWGELTEEYYRQHILGSNNRAIFKNLFGDDLDPVRSQQLADKKEAAFRERVKANGVSAVSGVVDFIRWAHASGYKLACVTNAPRLNALCVLGALDLLDIFKVLVIGEECENMKPHPEPYLTAASLLCIDPSQCIVFEDSPSGVKAGVAAGSRGVIAVASALSAQRLYSLDATLVIRHYEEEGAVSFNEADDVVEVTLDDGSSRPLTVESRVLLSSTSSSTSSSASSSSSASVSTHVKSAKEAVLAIQAALTPSTM